MQDVNPLIVFIFIRPQIMHEVPLDVTAPAVVISKPVCYMVGNFVENYIKLLLHHPEFGHMCKYSAEEVYVTRNGKQERLLQELVQADVWHDSEESLPFPEGSVKKIMAAIVYGDESLASSYGNLVLYPIFASSANIPIKFRNRHDAKMPVAFILTRQDLKLASQEKSSKTAINDFLRCCTAEVHHLVYTAFEKYSGSKGE